MSLAEIAETVPARKPGTPCTIATARDGMGPADRATFDGFLADPHKSSRWIADLLNRAYDLNVKGASVGHHRRRACRCR